MAQKQIDSRKVNRKENKIFVYDLVQLIKQSPDTFFALQRGHIHRHDYCETLADQLISKVVG